MNQRIAIFGAGLSGNAARKLALARGDIPTLFDEARQGDAEVFDLSRLHDFDAFVFSPGFSSKHPWRKWVAKSGKRLRSELGFAAEHWQGSIIGVTGTNGKTTLTRFLAGVLVQSGKRALAAGNIGRPLSELVLDPASDASSIAVCEISSFQAELPEGLKLDALLWTNFAEDHLDRYETISDYFRAKAGLLDCLKADAPLIIGPQVVPWFQRFQRPMDRAVIAYEDTVQMARLRPGAALSRPPYRENFSLAAAYWRLRGEAEEVLLAAAHEFTLSSHRLDIVAEKAGVTYWNDSKATNFHATLAALMAVPRPVIWIGGGKMKGGHLQHFAEALSGRIHAAVLYGEAAPEMERVLRGKVPEVHRAERFREAVLLASRIASASVPSQVLLSPGFSSLDQFNSYEERGKSFISTVLGL